MVGNNLFWTVTNQLWAKSRIDEMTESIVKNGIEDKDKKE